MRQSLQNLKSGRIEVTEAPAAHLKGGHTLIATWPLSWPRLNLCCWNFPGNPGEFILNFKLCL